MRLSAKNRNVLGASLKNPTFKGGSQKTNIEGGLPKKRGLGQFANLRGGAWQEIGVVVILRGVDTPMHAMIMETIPYHNYSIVTLGKWPHLPGWKLISISYSKKSLSCNIFICAGMTFT